MPELYIDGSWCDANDGARREVIDPFDGSTARIVSEGGPDDTEAAIAAARRAFDTGPWPRTPAAERAARLAALADAMEADTDHLAALETADTGKTLEESRADISDVIGVIRYYASMADHLDDEQVQGPIPALRSTIRHEPVGVCAQISPWNYPLLQASWKFAPALLAGNTMVIKPSELTPLTTIRTVELMEQVGIPAGVVNLVLGDGPRVGAVLAASHDVDLVSFTGGIVSGRKVMEAATGNVKKLALELGGKNPNIVFADADHDLAVDHALNAVFFHAGQVCSAGARLLVEASIHDAFVDALVERTERIRLGNGRDAATESGPLISAAHRDKVERYVAGALDEGATLRCGGRRPDDAELADGFFYRPTILTDCHADMAIVREEVFGPVLTVEPFEDEAEALALAGDTDTGLAAGVFTSDVDRGRRVAEALRYGTVWINDFHPYFPQAPWGGFKTSGIGRELGVAGLDEYVELKHIAHNVDPAPTGWFGRQQQGTTTQEANS